MSAQVDNGLLNDIPSHLGIVDLDGGEAHGNGEFAVGIPDEPDFEAENGLQNLAYPGFTQAQGRGFFLGDLAAALAFFGRLDLGTIHDGMDVLGEKGLGSEDADHLIE